jgi:hypothetical protein
VARVVSLSAKLDALTSKLQRSGAGGGGGAGAGGCIGSAFVTFNHEESAKRCLRAFGGSHTWWGSLTQPSALRLRHPATPAFAHPHPDRIRGGGWVGWLPSGAHAPRACAPRMCAPHAFSPP